MKTASLGVSALVLLAAVLAVMSLPAPHGVGASVIQEAEAFPHDRHEGLFPLCTGCHQGVETGEAADVLPDPASCSGCHDGAELDAVEWVPPSPGGASLLRYDHPAHARSVAEAGQVAECGTCHGGDPGRRMDVAPLEAGRCLECHEAPAGSEPHFGGPACGTCHVTAAASGLPGVALAALPVPAGHERAGFVAVGHGADAGGGLETCATCHVQQRCTSCHVTGAGDAIARMPEAPAGVRLPVMAAHYPVPASHAGGAFAEEHGRGLASSEAVRTCGTCHTQDDCASCHVDPGVAALLPARAETEAPGAALVRRLPPTHRSPFFMAGHATLASADAGSCATCHTEASCVACHDAPGPAAFHPQNFASRHSSASFGATAECSNCHDAAVFCRACHVEAGLTATGRLGSGYHDAEPVWLLRHGQAARQELESCASCHRQKECLQCHSQTGAFRVSPHRPGFDARRAWESNPVVCTACHLRSPFGEGG
ncbi:MAG: cytochrome c3 family protein [Longimicrobiales bacterium]